MRQAATLLAVVMLGLSSCNRSSEFKAQAELGQQIVLAIDTFRKQTGSYPVKLSDLAPKYLTVAPDITDVAKHKMTGWDYRVVTNGTEFFSLRYYMGRGGIVYRSPDWIGNDEGTETVVLRNR